MHETTTTTRDADPISDADLSRLRGLLFDAEREDVPARPWEVRRIEWGSGVTRSAIVNRDGRLILVDADPTPTTLLMVGATNGLAGLLARLRRAEAEIERMRRIEKAAWPITKLP